MELIKNNDLQRLFIKVIFIILLSSFIKVFSQNSDTDSLLIYPSIDTTFIENDTTYLDSLSMKNDSLAKPKKKEGLDTEIKYTADDTIKINNRLNTTFLYNNAVVEYGKIKLKAGKIHIDNKKKIVKAYGIPDSTGSMTQLPEFTDDGKIYYTQEMIYNIDTEQAIIKNFKTTEDEGYIGGRKVKKINDKIMYAKEFYFSTDENLMPWIEYPEDVDVDYFIRSNKVKIITGEKIFASESWFFLGEVATPLFIPSAFFPMSNKRSSGILMPTYSQNQNQGFGLVGGGYYFVINDHFDFTSMMDFYTKGSWSSKNTLNYKKRYKYNGRAFFSYEKLINGERGFSDYSNSLLYRLSWNHSPDIKANPTTNFSVSIDITSGKYFSNSLDQVGTNNVLNASTNSSMNLRKTFEDTPFSLSASMRHTQNLQTGVVNMTLPDVNISMNRIFPFSKNGQKKTWYQKIGVSLNSSMSNEISTYDSIQFTSKIFKDMRTRIQHSIPISTNFNVLKYFSLSPNINYTERWFLETIKKRYDQHNDTIIEDKVKGFDSYREFSTGASLGTTIYGMFDFGDSKLKAIRHIMKPSVSYSFRPDFSTPFWGYYEEFYTDPNLGTIEEYTRFENISSPSKGLSSSLGLSLSNTFEGKLTKKEGDYEDEKDKYEKFSIIDQLSFSTSYNMAAHKFKWSYLSANLGFRLIKNRLTINLRSSYDFYALDENNQRINEFQWDKKNQLLRYLGSSANASFSLSNADFNFDKEEKGKESKGGEGKKEKKDNYDRSGYLIFNMPWSLSFGYNINYNNSIGQKEISSNTVSINGSVSPTKNWKLGMSTGYDFKTNKVAFTSFNFSRNLNTFYMTFNWVPMGPSRNYNFFIGIKASMLSDLKWDKREQNLDRRL